MNKSNYVSIHHVDFFLGWFYLFFFCVISTSFATFDPWILQRQIWICFLTMIKTLEGCLTNVQKNSFMNCESPWSGILHFLIQYLHFHNGRKHFNTCSVRQQNYQRPNMKCNFFQITLIDSLSQKFTNQSRSQDALTPFGKIRANKNFVDLDWYIFGVFCLNW